SGTGIREAESPRRALGPRREAHLRRRRAPRGRQTRALSEASSWSSSRLPRQRVAKDGEEDLVPGTDRARYRSGDLGDADALAVAHGHFRHAQPLSQRSDLHLHRPAKIPITHADALQRIETNRPERPEVRVAVPIDEMHQEAGELVTEARLRQQRALLALPEHSRTDHQVGLPFFDRRYERRQLVGMVAEVSVHEHDDI